MAELRQTLAAGGYDVTKNNKRVQVVTRRLIDNVTLVQTRNASLRLSNKVKSLCSFHLVSCKYTGMGQKTHIRADNCCRVT